MGREKKSGAWFFVGKERKGSYKESPKEYTHFLFLKHKTKYFNIKENHANNKDSPNECTHFLFLKPINQMKKKSC